MSEKKEVSVIIKALDETVPGFKSARGRVSEFASEAKKMIAEAFAAFTVFEFFKTAIEKATEAEQSYAQLSNTLANVGVSYEHNRGQIDETIKSLQKVANVRSDEAIKGLNTLVQRSGDYAASLKHMTLVADLAAAKHIQFNDAADLVGRALGGNIRVLRQFGIVTKDAHQGLELLGQRLHGAAAADMATFGGQVEAVKIKFFNLAESFGDIITGSAGVGGGLTSVGGVMDTLTAYVEQNAETVGYWVTMGVAGVKEVVRGFADLVKAAFYAGEAIGFFADAIAHAFDAEKRGAAIKGMRDAIVNMTNVVADSAGWFDRLGEAAARAGQVGEQIATASAERLKRNKAAADAEQQKRLDAEAQAAQKKLDGEIARAAKVAELDRKRYATERAEALAFLAVRETTALAEMDMLKRTHAALTKKMEVEDRLTAIHKAQAAFDGDTASEKARDARANKAIADAAKMLLSKGEQFAQDRAAGKQQLDDLESAAKMQLVVLNADKETNETRKEREKIDAQLEKIQKARQAQIDTENASVDKAIARDARALLLKDGQFARQRDIAAADLAQREAAIQLELKGLAGQADATDLIFRKTAQLAQIHQAKKAPETVNNRETDKLIADLLRVSALKGDLSRKDRDENRSALAGQLASASAELKGLDGTAAGLERKRHLLEQIRTIEHALGKDEAHGFADALGKAMERSGAQFRDAAGDMKDFGTVLGDIVTGPLTQFGESTARAFGAMIVGSKTAGAAFRQAMLTALASVAKAEGDYFVARAFGGAAKGIGGNPLGFAEQAEYLLGAAAMYAVAGAASAAGSSGGGGGAGAGGLLGGAVSQYANLSNSNQGQGTVTIVLNGSKTLIDAADPRTQDDFLAMIRKLSGNRQVAILTGTP